MGYRISIYGDIYDVGLNFFRSRVEKDEKIGDTHFITIENGEESTTFSIYFKEYERVKNDMRDLRIDEILDSAGNI